METFQFFIFFLGWILISLNLFLKYTKTCFYIGSGFIFIFLLVYLFRIRKEKVLKIFFNWFHFMLILFLACLLPFIFLSSYKMASLEAFFLNYFSHVILYFALFYIIFEKFYKGIKIKSENLGNQNLISLLNKIFFPLALVNLLTNFYFVFFNLWNCNFNTCCFFTQSIHLIKLSLLKGVVTPTSIYTFLILISGALFFKNKNPYLKLFWGSVSLFDLFFIFWLGRRGVLLGIFTGFLILFILTSNKFIRKLSLSLLFLLIFCICILLFTHWGKVLLIRDNINLLLSLKYENFAKAGSFGMRLYIWPIYIKKALEEPFSGTGLGRRVQKRVLSETNKLALNLEHAHNLFLNLWLQAGLHTALLFLIIYIYTLVIAFKLWKTTKENYLTSALFVFLIAFFIMSMLEGMEEGTRFTPFWIASALVWGLWTKLNFSK